MELTIADFQPLVGDDFEVPRHDGEGSYTSLTLKTVEGIGHPHSGRAEPFSLTFDGPAESALPQGTFLLVHDRLGEHPIFIVPISESNGRRQYQAIFN